MLPARKLSHEVTSFIKHLVTTAHSSCLYLQIKFSFASFSLTTHYLKCSWPGFTSLFFLFVFIAVKHFCPNSSFSLSNASGMVGSRWDCACHWWQWERITRITSRVAQWLWAHLPEIKFAPSEDRNGMRSVPAELRAMSSFCVRLWSRDWTQYPKKWCVCCVCDLGACLSYIMCEISLWHHVHNH